MGKLLPSSGTSGPVQYYAVVYLFSVCILICVTLALNINDGWPDALMEIPFYGAAVFCGLVSLILFVQKKRIEDIKLMQTLAFASSDAPPQYLLVFSQIWISYLMGLFILLAPLCIWDWMHGSIYVVEWGVYVGVGAFIFASLPFFRQLSFRLLGKLEGSKGMSRISYERRVLAVYKGVLGVGIFPCLTVGFHFMGRYEAAWPLPVISAVYLLFGYVAISVNNQYKKHRLFISK